MTTMMTITTAAGTGTSTTANVIAASHVLGFDSSFAKKKRTCMFTKKAVKSTP